MSMRDLIPWSRPEDSAPARYREEARDPFFRLRHEMDRIFDDFVRGPLLGSDWKGGAWPSLEVSETDDTVRVAAELPGLNEKDIELTVQDGMLVIRGERKDANEDRKRGWSERYYGRFERRIALPDGADETRCDATFRDGVLTVTMRKSAEAARARRIPINAGTRH